MALLAIESISISSSFTGNNAIGGPAIGCFGAAGGGIFGAENVTMVPRPGITTMDVNKRKFDRQSRAPELAILCLSVVIVAAIGGLSYISEGSAASASSERMRTRTVIDLNQELLSRLKDVEIGQRGYLVTGQLKFLEPYNQALPVIPDLLARLDRMTQSTPDQHRRVREIEPLVSARLAEVKQTVDLRLANRGAEALAIVDAGSGKATMDQIRARCAALNQTAETRLENYREIADRNSSRLGIVGTVGSALLLGFLAVSAITIFRGLNRRDELFREAFEAEKKLAITLESIADGVIATDAASKIVFLNPVAQQLTGWNLHDCAGRHISEIFRIVNETTRSDVPNPLVQAIAQGEVVGLANHTKLIARDSTEFFIDDSAAPIRNQDGEIAGGVLVFRDVSERRRAEQELARSAEALARSNEELQHFAFTASHDLQSPLRSIRTMAELLARRFGERLGSDGAGMISYITDGATRMTHLVDDLLTLAKATDMDGIPVGTASLQEAFRTVCNSLSAEAQAAGASITAAELPHVAARDVHVVLVLQNLIGNSLKYRGGEPPVIEVAAVPNESQWIVSVKDNGIGIDPAYAEQIFQPFKRLHGKEYEGTGLGLWTCRRIVAGYGGRIWMESEPGHGSTFFFSMPAARKPEAAEAASA